MKPPVLSEHALQIQVADYLDVVLKPPAWWTAIDHAAKLGVRQAAMRKRRGVKRGLADFLIVSPGPINSPDIFWIELKRPGGGSLSQAQKDFAWLMGRCRVPVHVCRSLEEVQRALALHIAPAYLWKVAA